MGNRNHLVDVGVPRQHLRPDAPHGKLDRGRNTLHGSGDAENVLLEKDLRERRTGGAGRCSRCWPLPTLPEYPQPLLAKLNTYATGCTNVTGDCNAVNVAANVLTGYGNYPSLDASWFLALADVPGAGLQYITDAAGNQDIEFTFPAQDGVTGILVNATLLNKGDVQYEGYIRDGQQTLVLNQTPVSGPGVQPAS